MLNTTPISAPHHNNFKIFLAFVPRTLSDGSILSYFASFCTPETQKMAHFDERGRPLFTNYKVLNVKSKYDFDQIVGREHYLLSQKLYVVPFDGDSSFQEFISLYSNRCVYISGIPLTLNTDRIFERIDQECKLKDLFVLKNGLKVNKHYGFATFETEEIKSRALCLRKFKGRKFKVTIKEFDMSQLDKMLPKKKPNESLLRELKLPLGKSESKKTENSQERQKRVLTHQMSLKTQTLQNMDLSSVMVNPSPNVKVKRTWAEFTKLRMLTRMRKRIEKNHDWDNLRLNRGCENVKFMM